MPFPNKGSRYRSKRHPSKFYTVQSVSEPLRFEGTSIEAKIHLTGDDGRSYHCSLAEFTQDLQPLACNSESVPKCGYVLAGECE